MKPKDSVWLKPGILGLQPPENLGVVSTTKKVGKKHKVELITLKGKALVAREKVKARGLPPFEGELDDVGRIKAHLHKLIKMADEIEYEQKAREDKEPITQEALWQKLAEQKDETALSAGQLAAAWYGLSKPGQSRIRAIEKALQNWLSEGLE